MPTSGLHYEWHLSYKSYCLGQIRQCYWIYSTAVILKLGHKDTIFHTPVTLFTVAYCYLTNIWSNSYGKFALKCKEYTSLLYIYLHSSGDFSTQDISFVQTKHS